MALQKQAFKALGVGLDKTIIRSGNRPRLSVLTYHRVLPEPDPLLPDEVDVHRFRRQMELMASAFNVLPLGEATVRLRHGTLPPRAACITFDDGYANNATHALPVLLDLGVPACFFIATGYLGGGCMWNDIVIEAVRDCRKDTLVLSDSGYDDYPLTTPEQRLSAISSLLSSLKRLEPSRRRDAAEVVRAVAGVDAPINLMMSPAQVKLLTDSGMEVGGHTETHPILSRISTMEARQEIVRNKQCLEDITGNAVSLFAYPNGRPGKDFSDEHVAILKETGFSAAVTTAAGAASRDTDPYLIPRFTPWDRTSLRFLLRLYHNLLRAP